MDQYEKQAYWFEHLRAWSVSGLAQVDYCQRHQLAVSSFGYWRRRQRELPMRPLAICSLCRYG